MFHDLAVKGVACYKKCFKKHSIRECAYNKTLFDEAVVRDKGVVGRRQTERLTDRQADPQGAFYGMNVQSTKSCKLGLWGERVIK